MDVDLETLSIHDILFIIKKHFLFIILVTLACALIGGLISKFMISKQYEADALLIVNPGKISNNTITYDQVTMTQQLTGTYAVILKSNTVLDQVIQHLGLNTTAESLSNTITVASVDNTEVIQLSVKAKSARSAVKIANSIIKYAPSLIIRTVKAGSVEIVSSAKSNGKPVWPKTLQITLICFFAGLVSTLLISFGLYFFNNKISSDDDIRDYLEISVLGVIPTYNHDMKDMR